MTTSLRVRFDGKVLVPQEPVDLPVDKDLEITIDQEVEATAQPHPQSALEWLAQNVMDDPSLPPDLSRNLHHYLYGAPKVDE
jgi:hypothetical protein